MTIAERNNKLKHFITCLKCEVSGKCCDDNCSTQYDAGNMGEIIENLEVISKALEQEPKTFRWCTDCREYDQEKHCCHRWSKVIRDTVEEMKQEYIEREVLDKIRAEIIENSIEDYKYHGCGTDELIIETSEVLNILDKYKGESEET